MTEKKEKLFDQFPPVSYEEWRAKVDADLKGVPFEKKLVWRTNEGFNVQPMYRIEDIEGLKTTDSLPGEYPYVRGTRTDNNWLTRQEIIAKEPVEANKVALDVLTKGVNSLGFTVEEPSLEVIETLLKGINLAEVEINLNTCPKKAVALAKALVEYIKKEKAEETFRGSIDFNPIRPALRYGKELSTDIVEQAKEIIDIVKDVKSLQVLAVGSVMLNTSGAYIYQELGYALAWGAEWLTLLTDAGLKVDDIAKRIKFNMGISPNYFMEIAKFRAARMLWAQIVEQYKPECKCACKMMVHAATSKFNQSIFDAHVNLLRSQTETMSAALAGVDSITVSLAQEGWKLFLDVEDKGGFFKLAGEGVIQAAVNESNKKRHADMARRKEILLGTNQFPNFTEMAAQKIEKTESCGCGCEKTEKALCNDRQASDFEALRLATEHASNRPKVFMLTIGNLAMRLARAQFSSNFFGCAGYEIIDNIGFDTVQAGIDAAMEKNADLVVLCSSDDEYATFAPEAFELLAGRAEFVVAGAPACMEELQSKGITNFIHVRSNVLETLQAFNAKLLK